MSDHDFWRILAPDGSLRHKLTSQINPRSIGKEEPVEEVNAESVNTEEQSFVADDGTTAGTWDISELPNYDAGALVNVWDVGADNPGIAPLAISNATGGIMLYDASADTFYEMFKLFEQDDGVDNIIIEAEQPGSEVALESQDGGRAGFKAGQAGDKTWRFWISHAEDDDPDVIESTDTAVLQNVDRLDINFSAKVRFQDTDLNSQGRIIPEEASKTLILQAQNDYNIDIRQGGTTAAETTSNGLRVNNESGTTANRPASPVTGQEYFDTDLGQPIWYDGAGWVDAQGTSV